MRKILFLIIFFVSGACDGQQKGTVMKKEIIKKSYKKQIISDETNRAESEFYDEKTGVYSNFKYLVSFKKPKGWASDFGSGQFTLFRTYQIDSGYTMSLNVVETDLYPKKGFNAHELFDKVGKQSLIKNIMKAFESQEDWSKPKNFNVKKSYLNNNPVIKQTYQTMHKEGEFEFELTNINFQFVKSGNIITLSLIVPTFFFNEDESFFNSLFLINFLPDKNEMINSLK